MSTPEWDEPAVKLTSEALDAALGGLDRVKSDQINPIHLSPGAHAEACRLLGKPEGSVLTPTEVYRAAQIELEQM